MVTEKNIRDWFAEVSETLSEEGVSMDIFNEPDRIINMDESGFQLVPKVKKSICKEGTSNLYYVTSNSNKEQYTALFGSTASGKLLPPMILYSGQRMTKELAKVMPKEWVLGMSEDGWMTSKTFYEYVTNCLYNWLVEKGIKFPVIIFIDGHRSHVSLPMVEFCKANGIILISLKPNSTHILQPWDVAGFGPLKIIWHKILRDFKFQTNGDQITKYNFPTLLKKAVDQFSGMQECMIKGFQKCGLCPWNPDAVDYSKLPKTSTRESPEGDTHAIDCNSVARNQVLYIELAISEEKIKLFELNRSNDKWYGPIEDTSLFNIWRNAKNRMEGKNDTEKLDPAPRDTWNFILRENGEYVLEIYRNDHNEIGL